MHTIRIYMGKKGKKEEIFPLRRTEMNLENKRQNEVSQIDRYLRVKSKQSNSSRGQRIHNAVTQLHGLTTLHCTLEIF